MSFHDPHSDAPAPGGDARLSQWFAEEVQPHGAALRTWLRARFPTLADADDLVQEVYVGLQRARQTGSIALRSKGWRACLTANRHAAEE